MESMQELVISKELKVYIFKKRILDLKFLFLYKNLISSKNILKTLSSKNHIIYNKFIKKD